ncbi:hypothetical protein Tco_1495274 [Tanacetum coccineum]
MLLGINLLPLGKVNAARHKLTAAGKNSGFSECKSYKVKTVNGEAQLQALVDGKKIIVTEAYVRRDLQLNDEEDTDCLPNATIFEELTRMGYEKLSQKLTFYKAFFSPQWKFLIHINLQCLSLCKYFWRNNLKGCTVTKGFMVGKGSSGRDTPLFPTMMVQAQQEQGEGSAMPTDPHHTPIIIQPSTSQPQKKQRSRRPTRKDTEVPHPSGPITNVADEACWEIYCKRLNTGSITVKSGSIS